MVLDLTSGFTIREILEKKNAKFLVFGLNEGKQEKVGKLQKKIQEITSMGKEPIIAVIERRGEIIYYKNFKNQVSAEY